jgi:HAD superfamily phosphatase (TIGR01668 family)
MPVLDLLRPTLHYERVEQIDLAALRRQGIRALILDLDNTLVPFSRPRPARAVVRWVQEAIRQGFRPVILSNNGRGRVREVAERLGVPCIAKARKPLAASYRRALTLVGARPAETAVVGDQVFTDVLGGNRLGLLTILVRPLEEREFVGTRLLRHVERAVLRRLTPAEAGEGCTGHGTGRPGSTRPSGMRMERT